MLKDKKIILGVTGSIAAYKAGTLVRLLIKQGAEVQVVMTTSAGDFITPLTLSTLSGRPVLSSPFEQQSGTWYSHVDWATWADLILMAPLTANTMAKMAHGQVDNLLTAIYLAARCPVFFAPAMDVDMYEHPATQKNLDILVSRGNILIAPDEGFLASGLTGKGRLREPEAIVTFLHDHYACTSRLRGKKVLVTAGPTYEKIDPVRYVGNFSSGKMGYALADAFAEAGAQVTLVSGPTSLVSSNPDIHRTEVLSAEQMFQECMIHFPKTDITIMAAAVADYTPEKFSPEKIKKKGDTLTIKMVKTMDILGEMGKKKKYGQLLIGFALETEHESANALHKLKNKHLDAIVLNSLRDEGAGFSVDTNKVNLITQKEGKELPLMSKKEVAKEIVNFVVHLLSTHKKTKS